MVWQQTGKVPCFEGILLIAGHSIDYLQATTTLPGRHACLHLVDLQDQPSWVMLAGCSRQVMSRCQFSFLKWVQGEGTVSFAEWLGRRHAAACTKECRPTWQETF